LSIINTNAYLLEKSPNEDVRKQSFLNIQEQVNSIAGLIEDLVMVTRLDSGIPFAKERVQINELVDGVLNNFQSLIAERDVSIDLILDAELPRIEGSVSNLTLAIKNIMDNALHFTVSGGTINVRTCVKDDFIVLEIRDYGMGISADDTPHIFECFYRADAAKTKRGFGLGLPIAKSIAEMHDGRIELASEVGQGSTFRILLPADEISPES
jgi:signal transduction histidine kinase